MKKFILLFSLFFVVFVVGCSQNSEVVTPEEPDFIEWTKEYLDAGEAFFDGGSIEDYETAISGIVGKDLLEKLIKEAEQEVADIEVAGKVYTREEKSQILSSQGISRIKMLKDISPVYNDMDPERDFFKYVFVRISATLFDVDDEMIPEMSTIRLYKYWFQKMDGKWVLYNINEVSAFPNDDGEYTREFNGEQITFIHYKDDEIILTK